MRSRTVALVLAALVLTAAEARAAKGPDLVVNQVVDGDDGSCTTDPGGCSLREAINAVNAGPERSIGFDPAAFPPGVSTAIAVLSALPAVQRSGVSIDGAGTGVRIGGGGVPGPGLDFSSAPGTALSGVRVANLLIDGFDGPALRVCPGPPACADPLANVVVQNVYVAVSTNGVQIFGGAVTNVRIADSVAESNPVANFVVSAGGDATGIAIERSFATGGIVLVSAGGTLTGAIVADNVVRASFSEGILLNAGAANVKTRVTGNRVDGSATLGVSLNAGDAVVAPRVERNVATGSGNQGFLLNGGDGIAGGRFVDNAAVGNAGGGIVLASPSRMLVSGNVAERNQFGIAIVGSGSGNRVRSNRAFANELSGIGVQVGQLGNRISGNRAVANGGGPDLTDQNADCGTNRWTKNVARLAEPLCTIGLP